MRVRSALEFLPYAFERACARQSRLTRTPDCGFQLVDSYKFPIPNPHLPLVARAYPNPQSSIPNVTFS